MSPWAPPVGVQHRPFSLEGSAADRLIGIAQLHWHLSMLCPDLVISESPIAPLSFGRYRVLHMIHDAKFVTPFARKGGWLARAMHWISARMAHRVVTVSHSEKERLCKALFLNPERVLVSFNGISDAWFKTPRPSVDVPRIYDLLYVSNFAPHKGHMTLLRAIKNTRWRIAFVGADFGDLDNCRNAATEWGIDATFFSNLPEEALIETYDRSIAFVFPSMLEGFGIPYLEARARGLPVLANNIPAFRELQANIGGSIDDFKTSEAIKEAIEKLLATPQCSTDLSEYRWDTIANCLIQSGLN